MSGYGTYCASSVELIHSGLVSPASAWLAGGLGQGSGRTNDSPAVLSSNNQPLGSPRWRGGYAEVSAPLGAHLHPTTEGKIWWYHFFGQCLFRPALEGFIFIKHQDIIHRAHNSFLGTAWLKYDKMFHMRATMDPILPWNRIETEIWMEPITQGLWLASGLTVTTCYMSGRG